MKKVAGVLVLVFALAPPAAAQSGQERGAALTTQLMSPFCPGLTIHDCPTQESEELRAQIIRWAEDGRTNSEIVAELEREYGPNIRAIPADGNSWLIFAVPLAALLGGIVLAVLVARRWTRSPAGSTAESARWETSSESERARLEDELDSMKKNPWGRT